MNWSTHKIRSTFLEFFDQLDHQIEPSSPIVIKDDPTLMFTNAGMNQFKSIFVGNESSQFPRIANSQKCLRVSGKHNDLEEVGRDHYHHTMFEMLGNWSFGDYFKEKAISWAWKLLTEIYKLDKERIYVSVFSGDEKLGVSADGEAQKIWSKHISEDRILRFGRKENFWEMGDSGPCGPCSEIHYDLRSNDERGKIDGATLVNADHPKVIEIWNLVFIQYDHKKNGELVKLPHKYIDTGMGLERLSRVLQGVSSNYDIDVFKELIRQLERLSSKKYAGGDELIDVAFRVIVDHIRAVSYCIADGQLPSSTGAGYVIRRVLRRAIRFGYSQLGLSEPTLFKLVTTLVDQMGDTYPELSKSIELIQKVVCEEERSFQLTLANGLERFEQYAKQLSGQNVSGAFAFELYDTYGFPIDLTQMLAAENNLSVNMKDFEQELEKQKDRSRSASKAEFGDWEISSRGENSIFLGYDDLKSKSILRKHRKVKVKGKELFQLVLDQTPFYPEGGGQLGDRGQLLFGGRVIEVLDTKKENGEILHFVSDYSAALGVNCEARVDEIWRGEIVKNHTATHLLHLSLRNVLGNHVEQKGSLVSPDKLRFDFSHFEKVDLDDLRKVEDMMKTHILAKHNLEEYRNIPISKAKQMGAMALFGEKYGDEVRAIKFGDSVELCGGTHVSNTEHIGGFKLLLETSVASGVRRVEAITGRAYSDYVEERLQKLNDIERVLSPTKDLVESVIRLKDKNQSLAKQVEQLQKVADGVLKTQLIAVAKEVSAGSLIVKDLGTLAGNRLKSLAHEISVESESRIVVLGSCYDDNAFVVIAISKNLLSDMEVDANTLIKKLSTEIQGGGGGQPFLAMAGGTNKKGLQRALELATELLK